MEFPEANKSESSKNYIRLKDGDSISGVLVGKTHSFRLHWENKVPSLCKGQGCEKCKTQKPAFRFRVNMVLSENGQYYPKIFENGWKVYDYLAGLNKEIPIEDTAIKITRRGSGAQDTTYIITPKGTLSKEQKEAVGKVKLLDLTEFESKDEEKEAAPHSVEYEQDIPF